MMKRDGFTLLELATVMLLLGILFSVALPAVGRGRDTIAVRSARSDVLAAVSLARAAAPVHGGASIIFDTDSGTVRVVSPALAAIGDPRYLGRSYHVELTSPRGRRFVLAYDRLGIGRLANTTLQLQRGGVTQTVTISAYGRAR